MTETKYWHEHLRDIVRAMDVLEKMTKGLNEDDGVSDLEFIIPAEIKMSIYDEPTSSKLVFEDKAWWLVEDTEEDK